MRDDFDADEDVEEDAGAEVIDLAEHRRARLHGPPPRKLLPSDVGPPDGTRPRRRLPLTRAACEDAPRPCYYVTCRNHLYFDVDRDTKITHPRMLKNGELDLSELPETCALDVADRAPVTLEEIAELMNVTREAVRLIEVKALARLEALQRAKRYL